MRNCEIEDCSGVVFAKGWCCTHYFRARRLGSPDAPAQISWNMPLEERLDAQHTKQADRSGCWVWDGSTDGRGYGIVTVKGKLAKAHRVFYERFVGPISEGLELDHVCRNRLCCNPEHLDAVTHGENQRRRTISSEEHWALRPNRKVAL